MQSGHSEAVVSDGAPQTIFHPLQSRHHDTEASGQTIFHPPQSELSGAVGVEEEGEKKGSKKPCVDGGGGGSISNPPQAGHNKGSIKVDQCC